MPLQKSTRLVLSGIIIIFFQSCYYKIIIYLCLVILNMQDQVVIISNKYNT